MKKNLTKKLIKKTCKADYQAVGGSRGQVSTSEPTSAYAYGMVGGEETFGTGLDKGQAAPAETS